MPDVVHFEIPADDVGRAKKFYTRLFGWKITRWEGLKSANEYWLIDTEPETGNRKQETGGGKRTAGRPISGGIIKRQAPGHPFMNYVAVDSIDEFLARAESLGGKIVLPKQVVPGVGAFAAFMDTENNIIGLHQTEKGSRIGAVR
jgi:hypothetical protein